MSTIVIYHGNCIDGFTAAWTCWKKFGDEAEYIAAQHGDAPPDVAGKDVYIVDFSYKRQQLIEMHRHAKSLLVLDHHKSAEESLRGLDYCTFDMDRSGAGLAWDHFFGNDERTWLVDYVEDRDLWRFKLPHSKKVNAYISTVTQTFEEWANLANTPKYETIARGEYIYAYINRYVREMKKQARVVEFEDYWVPIVNAPYINISELVGALAEENCMKCKGEGELSVTHYYPKEQTSVHQCRNCKGIGQTPFAMGWFQRGDGLYAYSLRSRGEFDVSVLAKRHGGGGHKNAAGFGRKERI